MVYWWIVILTVALTARGNVVFNWSYGQAADKTYIFTNCHWWESVDHQVTTTITLLTLAENTSSIAVIPTVAAASSHGQTNQSLLGDYLDLQQVRQVQPKTTTFHQFLQTDDYTKLVAHGREIPFPKHSQEEYESKLRVYGQLMASSSVHLNMPDVDPENTNQRCHQFGGTMFLSSDNRTRYVFLDRIHFLHFCTEKFMPWWYDVRYHIRPNRHYTDEVDRALANAPGSKINTPIVVIHINDVMDSQKQREDTEIQRYARQIVDVLRVHQVTQHPIYLMYKQDGVNVGAVVQLLKPEFQKVDDFSTLFAHHTNNNMEHAHKFTEWALSIHPNTLLFIGNVHSAHSRNICLYRKTHGLPYAVLRGFAELRKVWTWNL